MELNGLPWCGSDADLENRILPSWLSPDKRVSPSETALQSSSVLSVPKAPTKTLLAAFTLMVPGGGPFRLAPTLPGAWHLGRNA